MDPTQEHWIAAKRVLHYLQGTKSIGLHYGHESDEDSSLTGYSDSDFAEDITRKSTSG